MPCMQVLRGGGVGSLLGAWGLHLLDRRGFAIILLVDNQLPRAIRGDVVVRDFAAVDHRQHELLGGRAFERKDNELAFVGIRDRAEVGWGLMFQCNPRVDPRKSGDSEEARPFLQVGGGWMFSTSKHRRGS